MIQYPAIKHVHAHQPDAAGISRVYSRTPRLPLSNRPTVILSCSKDGPKEQSPPHSTHFQRVSFEINKSRGKFSFYWWFFLIFDPLEFFIPRRRTIFSGSLWDPNLISFCFISYPKRSFLDFNLQAVSAHF